MKKKLALSILGLGLNSKITEAAALEEACPIGFDHKKADKKEKKRLRELARRQKRLDKGRKV